MNRVDKQDSCLYCKRVLTILSGTLQDRKYQMKVKKAIQMGRFGTFKDYMLQIDQNDRTNVTNKIYRTKIWVMVFCITVQTEKKNRLWFGSVPTVANIHCFRRTSSLSPVYWWENEETGGAFHSKNKQLAHSSLPHRFVGNPAQSRNVHNMLLLCWLSRNGNVKKKYSRTHLESVRNNRSLVFLWIYAAGEMKSAIKFWRLAMHVGKTAVYPWRARMIWPSAKAKVVFELILRSAREIIINNVVLRWKLSDSSQCLSIDFD